MLSSSLHTFRKKKSLMFDYSAFENLSTAFKPLRVFMLFIIAVVRAILFRRVTFLLFSTWAQGCYNKLRLNLWLKFHELNSSIPLVYVTDTSKHSPCLIRNCLSLSVKAIFFRGEHLLSSLYNNFGFNSV